MADIYPSIQFPQVNFQSLGDLPGMAEEARLRQLRQSLGNVDVSGSASEVAQKLTAAGGRLLRGGDLEGAMKLFEQGRKIEESASYGPIQQAYIKKALGLEPTPLPMPTPATGETPLGAVAPSAPPAAPGSNLFPPPGAGTIIPPGTIPGPQSALPPSPTEALINQAQAGMAPPEPPPTQLAGPPPSPDTAPPSWLQPQGLFAQPVPAAPPSTAPAAQNAQRAAQVPADTQIRSNLERLGGQILSLNKRVPGPALAPLMKEFNNELAKTSWTPEQKAYQFDQLQRQMQGLPVQSFSDYQLEQKVGPDTYKEAQTASEKVFDPMGEKANSVISSMRTMQAIMDNPKFVSGENTELMLKGISTFQAARGALVSVVPALDSFLPTLGSNITKPAQLAEAFRAMRNTAVVASAGGLSKAFSDADRNYFDAAFPGLMHTPAGNKLISDIIMANAQREKQISQAVNDYRNEKGARASAPAMYAIANTIRNKSSVLYNENGSPTALKKEIDAEVARQGQGPTPEEIAVGVGGALKSAAQGVGSFFGGLGSAVQSAPSPSQLIYPQENLPGRAKGGPVKAGKPYVVGEKGPETYVSSHRTIMPQHEGKVYYSMRSGKPMGRIRGGKAVPFENGGRSQD